MRQQNHCARYNTPMSTLTKVTLTPDREAEFVEVLSELREGLIVEEFRDVLARANTNREDYRFIGAETEGRLVAVAGYRIQHNFTNGGMFFFVEDLVTRSELRSQGAGQYLLREIEEEARNYGARTVELNSNTYRKDAHRFYLRERYNIDEFRFRKIL